MPVLRSLVSFVPVAGIALLTAAVHAEDADLAAINRIRTEAFQRSRVMDYLHLIADRNGPRLTGSPGYQAAAETAVGAFKEAGVANAQLEPWGTFGRGWSWSRVAVQMTAPQQTTLAAFPADYSPGTGGTVAGEVVFAPLWEKGEQARTDDLVKYAERIEQWKSRYRGTLRGKVVMVDLPQPFTQPGNHAPRFDDQTLAKIDQTPYATPVLPGPFPKLTWPLITYPMDKDERSRVWDVMPLEYAADRWTLQMRVSARIGAFLRTEGAVARLLTGWATGAGVIMQSDYGSYEDDAPLPPPSVVVIPEQYGRIHRLVERAVPVRLEIAVDAQFYPKAQGINVIAELPGKAPGGEFVMLGAHLDSWHGATGATDNGAGSAVVMEVMRILASLDRPLARGVRAALWSGEEQCLCGSRAYVKQHFADPVTMQLKPEHARLSAYFNLDNGAGRIRGVYLQGNDMARPMFEAWFAPLAELGVTRYTLANTFGTDHLSFNAVGLPAFQFVQDPLDYDLNTHHSNVDDVSHVPPGDLMQAAAVMAIAVYHAATRGELMPRKRLPAPLPARGELPAILR